MHRNHQTEKYGVITLVLAALVACFAAMMLPDIKRYLRIHRM